MKFRLLFLGLLILTVVLSNKVMAQGTESNPLAPGQTSSAIYLGPVIGYNMSMHSVNLASFAEDPLCPFFENGSSNGFHIGLFYEHILGNVDSKHSIVARFLYNSLPAYFEKVGDEYPSLVDDGQGGYTTVMSSTEHTVDVSYNLLSLDLMYKFRAVAGLVLTVGPTFDFVMSNNLTQKYSIVKPDNVKFKPVDDPNLKYENNDRTIIVYDGDIGKGEGSASTRFALKMGVQYEIRTGGKIDIIPGFFYNLGLTNATSNENWKVSAIQAGVDIRFAL
jgi:hypothetical protein